MLAFFAFVVLCLHPAVLFWVLRDDGSIDHDYDR